MQWMPSVCASCLWIVFTHRNCLKIVSMTNWHDDQCTHNKCCDHKKICVCKAVPFSCRRAAIKSVITINIAITRKVVITKNVAITRQVNECPVCVLHVCKLFLPTKKSLKIVTTTNCYDDQCTHDKCCCHQTSWQWLTLQLQEKMWLPKMLWSQDKFYKKGIIIMKNNCD